MNSFGRQELSEKLIPLRSNARYIVPHEISFLSNDAFHLSGPTAKASVQIIYLDTWCCLTILLYRNYVATLFDNAGFKVDI